MNITGIESDFRDVVQVDFDPHTFSFNFPAIYDAPAATITKLRQGSANQAKAPGDILLKNKLFFRVAAKGKTAAAMASLGADALVKLRVSAERCRYLPMNTARFTLMLAAAASIAFPGARAATAPKSINEFCQANPNLDFLGRAFYGPHYKDSMLPRDVAAVGATNWRCSDGKVYVCAGGAAGSACMKMNPSREPSQDIRQTCEDNPGEDFVATAIIGNSSSTWRCQGPTAKIIATVPLDGRGFMVQTWAPLFDGRGKINTGVELGADPR